MLDFLDMDIYLNIYNYFLIQIKILFVLILFFYFNIFITFYFESFYFKQLTSDFSF